MNRALSLAALLVAVAGLASSANGQVSNGDFEVGDADLFNDFDYFPGTFDSWTNTPDRFIGDYVFMEMDPPRVRTGAASAAIVGQFNGQPNASLASQTIAAIPGNLYEVDVWALHSGLNPILGSSTGFVSIEFRDAGDGLLELTTFDVTNAASLQDVWQNTIFSATAPAMATSATIALGHFQLNNTETGATYFDDAQMLDLEENTGLVNPGFDSFVPTVDFQPSACCVPGWMAFGNAFVNNSNARTGNTSLIFFGQFTGTANTSVCFQELPVAPGELVEAQSFAGQLAGDPLELDNAGFMSVEFLDSMGEAIEITRLTMIDASSPTDTFIPGSISATAPAGSVTAKLQFGFFQSEELDMMDMPPSQGQGAAYFDDSSIEFQGPNTGLINPGFDSFSPDAEFNPDRENPLPGWTEVGFNGGVDPIEPNVGHTEPANTGEFAAFMFGQFPGDNSLNDTVIFQDLPASPGEGVEVDAFVYQDSTVPLGPDNVLSMTLEFLDGASRAVLGSTSIVALDSMSPQGVYIPRSLSATAPAGTTIARINFVYSQANEGAGAALIDDVAVTFTPAPPCIGDLNGDNKTDVFDFNIFAPAFGSTGLPPFTGGDLDGDGDVDVFDFNIFAPDFGCPN